MEKFANRLKSEREKRKKLDSKWTQSYVAKLIGVARVTYTGYENGTKSAPMQTVNKLADIFEVPADYLSGRIDTINQNSNDKKFDSLSEINELVKKYGIEQMGFFDIEEWKNLSSDDIRMVEEHFKMIVKLAKERNKEN